MPKHHQDQKKRRERTCVWIQDNCDMTRKILDPLPQTHFQNISAWKISYLREKKIKYWGATTFPEDNTVGLSKHHHFNPGTPLFFRFFSYWGKVIKPGP